MFSKLVTTYVDEALAQRRRLDMMRWPGELPASMLDPTIQPENDWVGWKSIVSEVNDSDLDALEEELGAAFPPLYRDFLKYLHFVQLTENGLTFAPHITGQWRDTLRKTYLNAQPRERIIERGLIPFGTEVLMDAGPVCFDSRRRSTDGDCTVVFWDHESAKTDREIRTMFSSARKMFECLTLVARNDLDFLYHDESDEPESLPDKQRLLDEFLSLDPVGAGGEGKAYWTAWGVLGSLDKT